MSEQELSQDEILENVEEVPDEYVSPLASGDKEDILIEEDEEEYEDADRFVSDFEDGFNDDEDEILGGEFDNLSTELETVVIADGANEVLPAPELTAEEAKELTEHIRSTADVLYVLVARAHAGKAHLALGYSTFAEYVKEEFNISRSRAYQFLNQANVISAIEEAAPDGTHFRLSEAAARDLKNYVEELAPEIRERTEGLEPNEAGKVVEEIVSDYRDKLKQAKEDEDDDLDFNFDIDDLDDVEYEAPSFDGESGGGGGGSEFDDMENFDNLEGFGSDDVAGSNINIDNPEVFRKKLENVYAFYTALTALEKMPSPEDIADSIQEARRPHINASLPKAKAWLESFHEVWFAKEGNDIPSSSEAEEDSDEFEEPFEEVVREKEEFGDLN